MSNNKKPQLSDEQIDRIGESLIDDKLDIDSLLAEAEGEADQTDEAISDHDAMRFALGELSGVDYQRVDAQLEASPEDAEEMKWLRRESEVWRGRSGAQRVQSVARSIVWRALPLTTVLNRLRTAAQEGLGNLAASLAASLPLGHGIGGDELIAEGEAADGLIWWELLRGAEDSLSLRLRSRATNLKGVRLRLDVATWNRECVLMPVSRGVVGADVRIPAAERPAHRSSATAVTVSILEAAGSVAENTGE